MGCTTHMQPIELGHAARRLELCVDPGRNGFEQRASVRADLRSTK